MRVILILFTLVFINSCAWPPVEVSLTAHAVKKCIKYCDWDDEFPYLKIKNKEENPK